MYLVFGMFYAMKRKITLGLGRCFQIPAYPLKSLKTAILKEANTVSPDALASFVAQSV